jgi:hypothetical protein
VTVRISTETLANFPKTDTMLALLGKEAFARLKSATSAGKTVPAGIFWAGSGHKILVTRVEGGRVYFDNPEGRAESLTEAEFKLQLSNLNLPR